MLTRVALQLENVCLEGELGATPAGRALAEALPLELWLERWGDEYYGGLGAALGSFSCETFEVLEVGALAYWEPGNALCLFFGPTPASRGEEPRAASPVHLIGRVQGDWGAVKALGGRVRARLEER